MAAEPYNPVTAAVQRYGAAARQASGGSAGGSSADDILASLGLDMGSLATMGTEDIESADPLTWAAANTVQRMSILPGWVRDLQILGLGKEDGPPELFVYMRDKTSNNPAVPGNPSLFDTPQGLRAGEDSDVAASTDTTTQAQTTTRALNQPYLWDEDELAEAMKKMQAAGLDVKSFEDVNNVWQGLVERAAITFTASEGERKVTPWDVLEMVQRESGAELDEDGNQVVTHTNRSISQISEGEAWATLQSNLSNMLGRDPSDQEVRDFTYRMNHLAARNPSISKTISKYKNGELVSSDTNQTEAGFTSSDVLKNAYDSAQSDPGYAEFQASTTYFDAAMGALGAIGG